MPILRADFIGFLGVESASPGTRDPLPQKSRTTILDDPAQSLRAREAEAKCDHVWIFEARTLSTASPATMRDVRCRDRMEPSCREPGIQTHGGPDQERAWPACRAWGRARTCPASRHKLLESRGVGQRGAIQIHPLIRLACDSWQRRDQQLSIRCGSVWSSVLVWNAAARSRIGATAGGIERRPNSAN